MNRVRRKWYKRTETIVGPPEHAIARNAAITALYARWYTEHTNLMKWAGMAVFASAAAGRYLRMIEASATRLGRSAPLERQVDLIRRTNNGVFEDIGWTHVAYLSPEGGIDAVRDGLADVLDTHRSLLEGFESLEEARRMARDDPFASARLAWAGSRLLLKHEQELVVQPLFASFEPWFGRFYSLIGAADFDLDPLHVETSTLTAFTPYMLVHGRSLLRASGSLRPDLTVFDQRWFWIDHHALPCWMRAEKRPSVRAWIRELAALDSPSPSPSRASSRSAPHRREEVGVDRGPRRRRGDAGLRGG